MIWGLPLRESLPKLIDKLDEYGLRDRIKVIASARGFMFSLGCIQTLQCHRNTCPTGITTHNKRLQKGLNPEHKAVRVAQFVKNINHSVGIIAHSCGVKEPRELKRFHARIVTENGLSIGLDELHPDIKPPI